MNDETFDVFRTRVRLPPTPPRKDMIYYDRKGYEEFEKQRDVDAFSVQSLKPKRQHIKGQVTTYGRLVLFY